MEKAVDALMTDNVLHHFLSIYSLNAVNYKKLGDFENYVFQASKDGEELILRITHSTHRKLEELLSEVDWMSYLRSEGVKVPKVIPSQNENEVEALEACDGSVFYASLFSKAEGNQSVFVHRNSVRSYFMHGEEQWGKCMQPQNHMFLLLAL